MRVLIVDAGIGGLTLAALLRRWNVKPDLIDRAPTFDYAGYMHPMLHYVFKTA
jgi:2-polyprenyl-6-methoxyphenol hydroxylase-like FAD-dependent oxidoreductase